jgi:hypothetical protein
LQVPTSFFYTFFINTDIDLTPDHCHVS